MPHLKLTIGASVFLRLGFVFVVVAAVAATYAVIVSAAVAASVGALCHLFGEGGHRRRLCCDRLHHRRE